MNKRTAFFPSVLLLFTLLGSGTALRAQESEATDTTIVVPAEETTVETIESEPEAADTSFRVSALAAVDSMPVDARRVPEAEARALRADDDFWYLDVRPEEPQPRKQSASRTTSTSSRSIFSERWLSYLLWTIVGIGILAALLAFLSAMDASPFRRRKEALPEDEAPTEEDLFSFDFDKAIHAAVAAGNYRSAIRLHYLRLLRLMAERDIIQYRQERTNGAYVSQLYGTAYHADFFRATRYFEYAWYGQLPVSEATYERVRTHIDDLKNRLP